MEIDAKVIEDIVNEVIKSSNASKAAPSGNLGIFDTMDAAVDAADVAYKQYLHCSFDDRRKYVQAIRDTALDEAHLKEMSENTVTETGMGEVSYKIAKNTLAATQTPGVEDLYTSALNGDDGLTTIEYSPFGVVGSITPTTNPTETIINNSIGMLAAGDTVVFSPHPKAKNVTIKLVKWINEALEKAGAPKNLVCTVSEPSIENTQAMLENDKIRLLVATGGPAIVNKVLSSGKKAIGAGAGNPPVVVDETANIEQAAKDIIDGCSFDNNLPCTSEKEVIAVDSIADYLMFNMKKSGGYELKDPDQINKLVELTTVKGKSPNKDFVGKSAKYILEKLGINVGDEIKVIFMETEFEHPFVQVEMLMPILPVVRVEDCERAMELAVIAEHGNRHTAMMHSKNIDRLLKFHKMIQTTIFVKNGPSYAGIGFGGEGHATFTIAGPTGEGLTSAKSFSRIRRCVLCGVGKELL
ncbi:MAG: aldehyde dehydrogenase EutE [Coriobacteriia bacterium]|nr:aldehyde dehydrogenase EutE [Coriobacteriia bacterium]